MSVSVLEKIEQYQKSIEKYNGNEEKLLYYIKKLSQLPVTVAHLQETGVGRTINSLRKSNGDVRAAAKSLVSKWKDMVAAEEAEGEEEEVENRPDEVVPETKYTSPESNALKRRAADNCTDQSEKKKRKDHSPDHYSHCDSGQSKNSHHHRDQYDDQQKDRTPGKKKPYSPRVTEERPQTPENVYVNGHYSESDNDELRIEDDVQDEESLSTSDVEPSKKIHRSLSQDSVEHSPDRESLMKASSNKSHMHKDSKHRESSKHHHEHRDKSSRKEHSSSSHKIKAEKKDKSEKSHRKHEKHKSKESSRGDEDRKSPKKSHHSSSSKSRDKVSRSRENSDTSPVKNKNEKSVVKIKQEPIDTYEVKVKQELVDQYSDKSVSEKADKSESKKSTSSSLTSKSDKHKDKRKSSDKDRSKEKKGERKSSQKEKIRDLDSDGVDSFSGASFGDVLGMIDPSKSSKKKSLSSPSTSKGVTGYDPQRPELNYEKGKSKYEGELLDSPSEEETYSYSSLRPSVIDEELSLPVTTPYYRPLPQPNYSVSPTKKVFSEDEALSHIISSKQMRTKVYSGIKSGYTHVPSLFEICTRVLQDNIEALGYTGGVPFDLLKPVLKHATAEQLNLLEHYNPYLIEDTGAIWQLHCQKDFRNKKREEMETWRDMYLRCVDEREQKLKSLTSSIQNSMSKCTPVRKTKLANVEGTVKPPRGVARKQAKYGIPQPRASASTSKSSSISPKPSTSSSSTMSSSFGGRQTIVATPAVSVPNPRAASSHTSGSLKPKPKAPLMQKALQLVRNRFKR